MNKGKRLYDMGGDILSEDSNFYPSNTAQGSMWPRDGKKPKQSKKARANTPNKNFKDKCFNKNC